MRYETAAAFRRALTDHLSNRARREGVPVSRLQRQVTFERFLARLFRGEGRRWVLKGGYALELRLSGTARATRDLGLNVPPPAAPDLVDELQGAAELDMGDFFEFTVSAPASRGHLVGPPMGGYRLASRRGSMVGGSTVSHSMSGKVMSRCESRTVCVGRWT